MWKMLIISLLSFSASAQAALIVQVSDTQGHPVADAVVTLTPMPYSPPAVRGDSIDQINKSFVPMIKIIPVGTRVKFPNNDHIRHHVYSFSPAKTFEIPLYEGTPANEIVFDKVGIVALGCNIHDWMRGYVYVTDAPYSGQTQADGQISFDVKPNDYQVGVWHPRLKAPEPWQQKWAAPNAPLQVQFELKKELLPRRAPLGLDRNGY